MSYSYGSWIACLYSLIWTTGLDYWTTFLPLEIIFTPRAHAQRGFKQLVLSICQFVCQFVSPVKNLKSEYRQG